MVAPAPTPLGLQRIAGIPTIAPVTVPVAVKRVFAAPEPDTVTAPLMYPPPPPAVSRLIVLDVGVVIVTVAPEEVKVIAPVSPLRLVTPPPVPGGTAKVASSRRNFVVPADDPGSGTTPGAWFGPEAPIAVLVFTTLTAIKTPPTRGETQQ